MVYTKQEIIEMCEEASKDMQLFYNQRFVNYKGRCKNQEKEYYTEIIAEWLLQHFEKFDNIEQTERTKSYNSDHDGIIGNFESNRIEEIKAKKLFHCNLEGIGEIIDYQTPLKNRQKDKAGKIDLLSRNDDKKCVYILEFKRENSPETMLRCVLEAYTYSKIVCKDKLFKDFEIPADYVLLAAPFVYKDSLQYKEYIDREGHKLLHELMDKMNIKPFFLQETIVYKVFNQ